MIEISGGGVRLCGSVACKWHYTHYVGAGSCKGLYEGEKCDTFKEEVEMKGIIELTDFNGDPLTILASAIVAIGTDDNDETIITLNQGPDTQLLVKTPHRVAVDRWKEAL